MKFIVEIDSFFFAFLLLLLLLKIPPETLRPHVKVLLKVLVDCFKDESWPVRDGMWSNS